MEMSDNEYLFMEWLILSKGLSEEEFKKLSKVELSKLVSEWRLLYNK